MPGWDAGRVGTRGGDDECETSGISQKESTTILITPYLAY